MSGKAKAKPKLAAERKTEEKAAVPPTAVPRPVELPTTIELNAGAAPAASTEQRAARSDEELLRLIEEDPEMLLNEKEIGDDEALRLQKILNPYSFVDREDTKRFKAVAATVTNMRADYITKFQMVALVAFLQQMVHEWTVPPEKRRMKLRQKKKAAANLQPLTSSELITLITGLNGIVESLKDAEKKQKAANDLFNKENDAAIAGTGEQKKLEEARKSKVAAEQHMAALVYTTTKNLAELGGKMETRLPATAKSMENIPEVGKFLKQSGAIHPDDGKEIEIPPDMAKGIIQNFIDNYFDFDPALHVRSAHDGTKIRAALTAEGRDSGDPDRPTIEELRRAAPSMKDLSDDDKETLRVLTLSKRSLNSALAAFEDIDLAAALTKMDARRAVFRPFLLPIKETAVRKALDHVPPRDTFHRLRYYTEVNYEELRTVTSALYDDKPELEQAIGLWKVFEGADEKEVEQQFREYCQKNEDAFRSGIDLLKVGTYTLPGGWKENRKKIDYYGKQTEVLKRIMDRHAEDARLGAELMKKRVHKEKAKNIREAGPDPPGLKEYQKQSGALAAMGVEKPVSGAEMRRLEKARGDLKAAQELRHHDELVDKLSEFERIERKRELSPEEKREKEDTAKALAMAKEMLEVPDGAIQIDVFTTNAKSGTFKKSSVYTEAEAPEEIGAERKKRAAELENRSMHPLAIKTATAPAPQALAPHALAVLANEAKMDAKARHDAALKDQGISASSPGLGLTTGKNAKKSK